MSRSETLRRIRETGIVPVVRASSAEQALALVLALKEGGVDVIELTMTVPGAVRLIEALVARFGGDVVVGAGTVLDAETARTCILAGAEFVVSPALDLATIACCRTYGIPVLPGALTPTEIVTAWRAGADMVKVFPCSAVGGAAYIKALRAPLPQIDLVPTGGVSLENVGAFVRAGASAIGAGADLVDPSKLDEGALSANARKYLAAIKQARAEIGRRQDGA
jgi:2-dehydro-3-deoxyphosphogluconate aldolase/(4S)-4-hydroxy-2-oxoglutarate aldolase